MHITYIYMYYINKWIIKIPFQHLIIDNSQEMMYMYFLLYYFMTLF